MIFGHYALAIEPLKRAELHLPSHKGLMRSLSHVYEELHDFESSLEYTKRLKKSDAEEDEDEFMWLMDTVLREGKCYKELKQFASAASCFQEFLTQRFAFEIGNEHSHAVSSLFTCYIELGENQSIIDMLQRWAHSKGENPEFLQWIKITTLHDNIHDCIILAAKRANAVESVHDIYSRALSELTLEDPNTYLIDWAKRQLRHFEAILMSHGSQQYDDHEKGIILWEKIIEDARSDHSDLGRWTIHRASQLLAQCLLDSATVDDPSLLSTEKMEKYATKLRKLLALDHPSIHLAQEGQKDLRLCSIRLSVLKNDHETALIEAKDRLIRVFDEWPDDPEDKSLQLRFQNLASTLTALDDDENAIAAWQAVKHKASPETVSAPIDKAPTSLDELRSWMKARTDSKAEPTFYISEYHCDACSTAWDKVLADVWTCKHCLCVQLCANCFQKRGDDGFPFLLCKRSHEMLYLPPIDPSRWKDMSPDTITVNNQVIPRSQWLDQLREKYGVTQSQINEWKLLNARRMDASVRIAGYMFRWFKKVKSRSKSSDADLILPNLIAKTSPRFAVRNI